MGMTLRAPARAAAHLLVGLATSLVAVSNSTAQAREASGDDLPAAADEIRCPDCNDDGKMPCPTCGGRGELSHACEVCGGKGRRPCPVCCKEVRAGEAVATATPGRVACDSCGGKGTIGSQGKPCPRCGGAQTLSCTTCGGKGTLPCRKIIYDKICPTCRFVGKVTCTTCGGTTLVSPVVLAARRNAAKKRDKADPSLEPGSRKSAAHADDQAAASEPRALPQELPARYLKLTRTYESHLDIFADDPKLKLEPRRREAMQLLRQFPASERGEGTVPREVECFVAKVDHLRKRWGELRSMFDAERTSYLKVKSVWESQDSKLSGLPGHLREEASAELNSRIDLVLRISERRSQLLEGEEPAWLPKELESIESAWPELKKRCEAKAEEVALAAAASLKAAKTKREAAQALVRTAKSPTVSSGSVLTGTVSPSTVLTGSVLTGTVSTGSVRTPAGRKGAVPAPDRKSTVSLRDESAEGSDSHDDGMAMALSADRLDGDDTPGTEASGGTAAPAEAHAVRLTQHGPARRDRTQRASADSAPAGAVHPAAWALAGFGAAVIVFWLASRSRRSEPGEDAPPAVS